jgi:polyisoprenoid-binding protein YceI
VASQHRQQLPNLVRIAELLYGLDDVVKVLSTALGPDHITDSPGQENSHSPGFYRFFKLGGRYSYSALALSKYREAKDIVRRYMIDPEASLMSLDGRSTLHLIHAETSGLTGWIDAHLVPESGRTTVNAGKLVIPLSQLSSGNALYDAELRRRVDTRRYPTATAELSSWQPTTTPGSYRVTGNVTVRGTTRVTEDEMWLSVEDERTIILNGGHLFDIRDFNMDPPRLLAVSVQPEVTIAVALVGRLISP